MFYDRSEKLIDIDEFGKNISPKLFILSGLNLLFPLLFIALVAWGVIAPFSHWPFWLLVVFFFSSIVFAAIPVLIFVRLFTDIFGILSNISSNQFSDNGQIATGFSRTLRNFFHFSHIVKKINTRLKTINLENQILYDNALAIHTASSTQELLDTVIARLTTHLLADFGLVFLLDDNTLNLTSQFNVARENIEKTSFRLGEGLVGLAVQEDRPILANDVQNERNYIRCVPGTKAQLTVPLKIADEVLGVLVLGSWNNNHFHEEDFILLKVISGEIALAVKNAKLTRELKREKDQANILYEASLRIAANIELNNVLEVGIETVSDLINPRTCSIMLFNEDTQLLEIIAAEGLAKETKEIVKLNIGEGIAGRAFQEGSSILVAKVDDEPQFKVYEDQKEGFKSVYCAPFLAEDKPIGVLNVETEFPLSQEKCKLVDAIASQVSVAVANALLYQSIEDLAVRDGLIGIYNHRFFQEKLATEFTRAQRYQRDLSLVILDIDDFKQYNDTYGHLVGDYLLKEVGKILSDNLRTSDILARYGGDEMAIILPETTEEEAYALMERLREIIACYDFGQEVKSENTEIAAERIDEEIKPKEFRFKTKFFQWLNDFGVFSGSFNNADLSCVSISSGIASICAETETKEDLIKKADQALFQAKQTGKNKVCRCQIDGI